MLSDLGREESMAQVMRMYVQHAHDMVGLIVPRLNPTTTESNYTNGGG